MLNNQKIQIIGLTGLAGHGKTEVADLLVKHTGFHKIAFGDAVKAAAAAMYNIDLAAFYEGYDKVEGFDRNTTVIEPYGMTVRAMMRNTGDAMKNQCGGDFWIHLALCKISMLAEQDGFRGVIVEDIRYDDNNPWGMAGDEYAAVKRWGGKVLHVDAMERVGRKDMHGQHCSEKGVKRLDGDIVIDNNNPLETLDGLIEHVVKTHGWYKL